jgi:hypothetical protein
MKKNFEHIFVFSFSVFLDIRQLPLIAQISSVIHKHQISKIQRNDIGLPESAKSPLHKITTLSMIANPSMIPQADVVRIPPHL